MCKEEKAWCCLHGEMRNTSVYGWVCKLAVSMTKTWISVSHFPILHISFKPASVDGGAWSSCPGFQLSYIIQFQISWHNKCAMAVIFWLQIYSFSSCKNTLIAGICHAVLIDGLPNIIFSIPVCDPSHQLTIKHTNTGTFQTCQERSKNDQCNDSQTISQGGFDIHITIAINILCSRGIISIPPIHNYFDSL